MRSRCADQAADSDHATHDRPVAPNVVEPEREAPLEKNYRHGQRHHRKQQVSKEGIGLKPASDRSEDDSCQQQQEYRGQTDTPGDDLGHRTGDGDGQQRGSW